VLHEAFWTETPELAFPLSEDDCALTTAGEAMKHAEMTAVRDSDFNKTNTPDGLDSFSGFPTAIFQTT